MRLNNWAGHRGPLGGGGLKLGETLLQFDIFDKRVAAAGLGL